MINSLKKIYLTNLSNNKTFYKGLYQLLGFFPSTPRLYRQAFLHNSTSARLKGIDAKNNNERLEYLGDAVLDLVIAELLFKKFPFQGEGFLTEMRSKSVSRKMLADIAQNMGIHEHIVYAKNISKNRAAVRTISGNALEALVGAVYLDKGYSFTKRFIQKKIVTPHLDFDTLKDVTVNFKSLLNQHAQKEKKTLEFRVLNDEGKQNIKIYIIGVYIDDVKIADARGKSKKVAEQLASEKACELLQLPKS
ncbi:ribonuclease III [Bacteroidia bacterium]|nr:ribonuclease III [Bacteroidia bacterium]